MNVGQRALSAVNVYVFVLYKELNRLNFFYESLFKCLFGSNSYGYCDVSSFAGEFGEKQVSSGKNQVSSITNILAGR